MSRPRSTTSTHHINSTPPTLNMETTSFQDEDFTESLAKLINNNFTLLELLEDEAAEEERKETASIETAFYSIEYRANTSGDGKSAYSHTSTTLAPSAPSTSSPIQSIRRVSRECPSPLDIDNLIELAQCDTLLTVTGKLKIMEAIMRENELAKAYVELSHMKKVTRILWYDEKFPGEWLAFGTAASENAAKVVPIPPAFGTEVRRRVMGPQEKSDVGLTRVVSSTDVRLMEGVR